MSGERLIGGSSGWAMVIVSVVAILGEMYAFILGVDALTQVVPNPSSNWTSRARRRWFRS